MEHYGGKESHMQKKKGGIESVVEPKKPPEAGKKIITDDDMHSSLGEKTKDKDPTSNEQHDTEMIKPPPSKSIN